MATFDDILTQFLDDPRSGILPGADELTIDNVAWHDYAQYEFIHAPVYYDPPVVKPQDPSSSGSGSGGSGDIVVVIPCHSGWNGDPGPYHFYVRELGDQI